VARITGTVADRNARIARIAGTDAVLSNAFVGNGDSVGDGAVLNALVQEGACSVRKSSLCARGGSDSSPELTRVSGGGRAALLHARLRDSGGSV